MTDPLPSAYDKALLTRLEALEEKHNQLTEAALKLSAATESILEMVEKLQEDIEVFYRTGARHGWGLDMILNQFAENNGEPVGASLLELFWQAVERDLLAHQELYSPHTLAEIWPDQEQVEKNMYAGVQWAEADPYEPDAKEEE